jgi:hypothetical protein
MVDVLTLELVADEADDDWFGVDRVRILVNGTPLRELAEAAGLAEEFCYPTAFLLTNDHLFDGPDRWEDAENPWFPDNQTALLADGCGQPGCDSLQACITSDSGRVSWSDLTWYRRPGGLRPLGPFHFDEVAYRSEVERVRNLVGR